jgi:hypothetical protein
LGQRHLVCLMVSVVPLAHDMFREVLDCSVTAPDRSETQSPTGSMRTIRSMASTSTHSGSAMSGSHSTTFLPPMESIPDLSGLQPLSGSSAGSLSHQLSLRSHAADDAAISNQTIVYPGDPRVIAPSRSSSLRRTTSTTNLGEEFESALLRRQPLILPLLYLPKRRRALGR